jgi:hypothetical protein
MPSWEPDDLPYLTPDNHIETSKATPLYNCIAWAAGDDRRYWWPCGGYWPKGVPREETLEAFVQAFEVSGYELCEDGSLEPGFEKVALYIDGTGIPAHAALQLPDGRWTSKLGHCEDITHSTLDAVNCKEYGYAQWFLKRERTITNNETNK